MKRSTLLKFLSLPYVRQVSIGKSLNLITDEEVRKHTSDEIRLMILKRQSENESIEQE